MRTEGRGQIGTLALAGALALAVVVPTADDGGFGGTSKLLLAALGGLVLLVVVELDLAGTLAALRSPIVLVLVTLSALSAFSVAWTVASAAVAVQDALAVAGYACVAVGAAVLVGRGGLAMLAVGICALAGAEALIGLSAAATHTLPDAERLVLVWRPGGSFQYQPALALLQAGVLPMLEAGMRARPRVLAASAAAGAAIAGAALAMSADRLGIGLAVVIVLACLVVRARRAESLVATVVLALVSAIGAVIGLAELNVATPAGSAGPGLGVVAVLIAVAVCLAVAWVRVRDRLDGLPPRRLRALAAGCMLVAVAAIAWRVVPGGDSSLSGHLRSAGFLHGRPQEWLAAVQTWLGRPVLGWGAGSYGVASLSHQAVAVSIYAHDLPLEMAAELGVPGLLLAAALYGGVSEAFIHAIGRRSALLFAPLSAAFMVSNLVDWTWHLAGLGAVWAAATGALIGMTPRPTRAARNQVAETPRTSRPRHRAL